MKLALQHASSSSAGCVLFCVAWVFLTKIFGFASSLTRVSFVTVCLGVERIAHPAPLALLPTGPQPFRPAGLRPPSGPYPAAAPPAGGRALPTTDGHPGSAGGTAARQQGKLRGITSSRPAVGQEERFLEGDGVRKSRTAI